MNWHAKLNLEFIYKWLISIWIKFPLMIKLRKINLFYVKLLKDYTCQWRRDIIQLDTPLFFTSTKIRINKIWICAMRLAGLSHKGGGQLFREDVRVRVDVFPFAEAGTLGRPPGTFTRWSGSTHERAASPPCTSTWSNAAIKVRPSYKWGSSRERRTMLMWDSERRSSSRSCSQASTQGSKTIWLASSFNFTLFCFISVT